jgi:hypothetical protein
VSRATVHDEPIIRRFFLGGKTFASTLRSVGFRFTHEQ